MATFTFPTNSTGYSYTGPTSGIGNDVYGDTQRRFAAARGTAGTEGTLTSVPPPDAALLQSITADIGSLNAEAAADAANSEASALQSTGYGKEIDAYNAVGAISEQNATIEGVSGNIKQLQANRQVARTIGSQRAAVAGAGFASSGGSLDLMKSSIQEGYLNDQIIGAQTEVTKGGFLEQGAAAQAEASGARVASDAALALSKNQAAAGQLALANAANQTTALNAYLATKGTLSPIDQLVTGTLAADPNKPTDFPTNPNPNPVGVTPASANRGAAYSGGIGTPYVG